MGFYFHVDGCSKLITRTLAVICWLFLLTACGPSRTEKSCLNTAKESMDMTSKTDNAAQSSLPLNNEMPAPVGQETAIFGMG